MLGGGDSHAALANQDLDELRTSGCLSDFAFCSFIAAAHTILAKQQEKDSKKQVKYA